MLTNWIILARLLMAAVLSGVIGFEREFHGRAAGFRTHILLCVGSTLVMLTSIHIFDVYYTRIALDPARIAAGVVTGIGFLGAGAIMHLKSTIRGLTTAASLWVVAGIGLAVGSGLYFGAIVTAALTVITLMVFSRLEYVMIRRDWFRTVVIHVKEGPEYLKAIKEVLSDSLSEIRDFEADRPEDGQGMVIKLGLKLHDMRGADKILEDISRLDGVRRVRWDTE